MMLKRILVGLDLDAASKSLLKTVDFLARTFKSQIVLLHVIEEVTPQRINEEFFESVRDAAELSMKRATETLDVETTKRLKTFISHGNTFTALIEKAREQEADLIIIGPHRKAGLAGVILGNTAQRIVRKAPCPVVVVKGGRPAQFDRILVPVDFSEPSRQSLVEAIDLARILGSSIAILHVIEPIIYPYVGFAEAYVPPVSTREEMAMARSDLKSLLGSVDMGNVPFESTIRRGNAAETIKRYVRRKGIDLVVMGTHGRTGLPHVLIGSTTEKVVRESSCSVLTIRPKGFRFAMP